MSTTTETDFTGAFGNRVMRSLLISLRHSTS
jgi:hypothetical protein